MNFVDMIDVAGTRRRTEDGALIVDARAARTGIQLYSGSEVDKPEMTTVKVFRGADEVFSRDSLASFAHRPITVDHPPVPVTVDNWRQYAVGQTADEVTGDGIYVRVPLMVSDAAAISQIDGGKRELSVGYSCDLDWTPGFTKDGDSFDARQKAIKVNHIAIVTKARGGKNLRIGDAGFYGVSPIINDQHKEEPAMTTVLKNITFDGFPIADVSPAAEIVINRLIADRDRLTTTATAAIAEHKALMAAKDEEIGGLKAQVKTLTDASKIDVDKLVRDRAALVGVARALVADCVVDGKTDAEIRKAVVSAKLGDAATGASDAEIVGMFKAISKDVQPAATADAFRAAMIAGAGNPPAGTILTDNGQVKYETTLADRWKTAGVA